MISFKGRHHQQDIILQCVRWYVAYSLSYRDLEELMRERGYAVDHSTIQRWVIHYAPRIEKAFRKYKKRTGLRWRLDETYVKIKGEWKYLYRAVDKQGHTVDFLLTAKRDKKAARRFLNKAIGSNGKPSLINIDKSGANTAAIKQYNSDENKRVKIRQCKYLNNIIEQDHRFIKRMCCCRCKSAVICRDLILTRRMPGGFLSSTFGGWFLPDFLGACWFWLFPGSDVAEPANGLPPIASWQS